MPRRPRLPRGIVADIAAGGRPVAAALDRAYELRRDPATLGAARKDPAARVLVVHTGGKLAPAPHGGLELVVLEEALAHGAGEESLRFLGLGPDRVPYFSLEVDHDVPGERGATLRDLLAGLSDLEAGLALEAVGLAGWHRSHRYCPNCGAPSTAVEGGHSRACASCGGRTFPRMDPAVIMLVTDGDRCVLGRRNGAPEGRFSTLAGFVETGESAEEAVWREVREEVGLEVDAVSYQGSQPWPMPASLMFAYRAHAAYAPLRVDEEHVEVRWFDRVELIESLASGAISIPPPIAAGFQLIEGWLAEA